MQPLVSIIIRTFNNEKTILKTINSALLQSYKNLEILVINDGSTDKTDEIIKSISDKRISIINQDNLGPIDAAYSGINASKGEYLTFLDADDELSPDLVKLLCMPLFDSNYGFSYCDYFEVNREKKTKKKISLSNFFNILACGVVFKRELINTIDFWDKNFTLPEYDFIIRVSKHFDGLHVSEPLYIYNRHSNSMTANKDLVKRARGEIFEKYGYIDGFKDY